MSFHFSHFIYFCYHSICTLTTTHAPKRPIRRIEENNHNNATSVSSFPRPNFVSKAIKRHRQCVVIDVNTGSDADRGLPLLLQVWLCVAYCYCCSVYCLRLWQELALFVHAEALRCSLMVFVFGFLCTVKNKFIKSSDYYNETTCC